MQLFWLRAVVSLAAFLPLASAVQLNPDDEGSLKSACALYARGLINYYKNNATDTPRQDIGILPKPLYWWEAGAMWGSYIEYSAFTGDSSYENTIIQALVANSGPKKDIILPWRKDQEGNDDQAFWALSFMSAVEYQFQDPAKSDPQYLEVVKNAFDNIASRWDNKACNGGLKWQIYPENAYGYNYKNAVSNGAMFALGARLARYTGEKKYAEWAERIWDWSERIGFISDKFEVFDGADDRKNCSELDHTQWSYNIGLYLHGAAGMYDFTKGSDIWKKRTSGLLDNTGRVFFKDDVMKEGCEAPEKGFQACNDDQKTFKAYLSRFLAKTAILAPFTKDRVTKMLRTSAIAAAKSCSGGIDGVTCGMKWTEGSYDNEYGVGQQMSALEVTQSLLMLKKNIVPAIAGGAPKESPSSSSSAPSLIASPKPSTTAVSSVYASSKVESSVPASSSVAASTPPAGTTSPGGVFAPSSTASPAASTEKSPLSNPSGTGVPPPQDGGLNVVPTPSSKKCDCIKSTVIVTVYPTPTPTPSATVPTYANGTGTYVPPTGTGLPLFTGAAAANNVKMAAGGSIIGAILVAMFGAI
ncbi:hypothetical protein GQ43DRAFT_388884 [Delitschia confertaspora ATCC 74209]|uniref:mannan endo-1,6-alpha-mannosidase n=1 Tax=Delitschia confertaspora ATCC 74209 TaxID=1513339 RepID=A0A9P4MSC2_9PLEO|nr:hypothetical protein GQ43DRAFT_388884 [Delitschia confertaspora ATCC 74209]